MTVVYPCPSDEGSEVPPLLSSPMMLKITAILATATVALEISTFMAGVVTAFRLYASEGCPQFHQFLPIPVMIWMCFFTAPYLIGLYQRGFDHGENIGGVKSCIALDIIFFFAFSLAFFELFFTSVNDGKESCYNREAQIMAWVSLICGTVLIPLIAVLLHIVGIYQGQAQQKRFELPVKN